MSKQLASCSRGSFRLPLDSVTWLRCGIDFCEGLEENHISFYWLESYINCIMKNIVDAWEKPVSSTIILFGDNQHCKVQILQKGRLVGVAITLNDLGG